MPSEQHFGDDIPVIPPAPPFPSEGKGINYLAKEHSVRVGHLAFGWKPVEEHRNAMGIETQKDPSFWLGTRYGEEEFHWGGRALWVFLDLANKEGVLNQAVAALPEHVVESFTRMGGVDVFLGTGAVQYKMEEYASSPMMSVWGPMDRLHILNGASTEFLNLKWDTATAGYVEEEKGLLQRKIETPAHAMVANMIRGDLAGVSMPMTPQEAAQLIYAGLYGRRGDLEVPDGRDFALLQQKKEPGVVSAFAGFDEHDGKYKLAREGHLRVSPHGHASIDTLESGRKDYAWVGQAVLQYEMLTSGLRGTFENKPFGFMQENNHDHKMAVMGYPWGGLGKLVEGREIHAALNALAEDGLTFSYKAGFSEVKVSYPASADIGFVGKPLMVVRFCEDRVEVVQAGGANTAAVTTSGVYGEFGVADVARKITEIGAAALVRPEMVKETVRLRWTAFEKTVGAIEESVAAKHHTEDSPKGEAWRTRLGVQGDVAMDQAAALRQIINAGSFADELPKDARAKLHFWSGEGQKKLQETVAKAEAGLIKEAALSRGADAR